MAQHQQQQQPPSQATGDFKFPQEYFFPAFFTRQANLATHHAQRRTWTALVLSYARHHRLFRLRLSEAAESDLFWNRRLERRLQAPDVRELVEGMVREGSAEYLAAGASSGSSSSHHPDGGAAAASAGGGGGGGGPSGGGGPDVVLLYWKKPEEWAALVEAYVEETGQKGSVLTVYEISEGDGTRNTELHGIDSEVLRKALNILVKRGKAQIFGQEDSLGVKFF
ncbi:hypothetical protein V2A60_006719 [Cordyceps javanica]